MLNIIIKYLLEAIVISFAAYYIPKKELNFVEIFKIAITGAITYLLLDLYSPLVSTGLRLGTGMSIGNNMVNNPVSITGMIPNNSNPIIGGDKQYKTECVNFCKEEKEEDEKEQCIQGCNDLFKGGSFSSNPLQLKGGDGHDYQECIDAGLEDEICSMLNTQTGGDEHDAYQECMDAVNDYDLCSTFDKQTGGDEYINPTLCDELGIPLENGKCEINY